MKTVRDYLRHAQECEALARKAISEEQREMIKRMADTWRTLAETREKKLLPQRDEIAKLEAQQKQLAAELEGGTTGRTGLGQP